MDDVDKVESFSIIITFSEEKVDALHGCLHYLNKCKGIEVCEILLILYQNEYIKYDFSQYKNINYKIIHSKRNNDKNIFCLSHARNIGLIRAKYDWVLMLDCDIMLPEDTCYILSHPLVRDSNKVYFTERINVLSNKDYKNLDDLYEERVKIDNNFLGFFHFYNRLKIIEIVGGYDEEMVGWGREDLDMMARAHHEGMIPISLHKQIKTFHVIHEYGNEWKYDGSDECNYYKQVYNLENDLIKKENIGILIT